jgi:hypothetical protein
MLKLANTHINTYENEHYESEFFFRPNSAEMKTHTAQLFQQIHPTLVSNDPNGL